MRYLYWFFIVVGGFSVVIIFEEWRLGKSPEAYDFFFSLMIHVAGQVGVRLMREGWVCHFRFVVGLTLSALGTLSLLNDTFGWSSDAVADFSVYGVVYFLVLFSAGLYLMLTAYKRRLSDLDKEEKSEAVRHS